MKLGRRRKYHKGRAAIRHLLIFANLSLTFVSSSSVCSQWCGSLVTASQQSFINVCTGNGGRCFHHLSPPIKAGGPSLTLMMVTLTPTINLSHIYGSASPSSNRVLYSLFWHIKAPLLDRLTNFVWLFSDAKCMQTVFCSISSQ